MKTIQLNFKQQSCKQYINLNDLHLWCLKTSDFLNIINTKYIILSHEEKSIAEKFVYEKDFQRYCVSHILLRLVLEKYLNADASSIKFKINKWHKPYLKNNPLVFNLTHSNEVAIIAISRSGLLGVDVEYVKPTYSKELISSFMNFAEQQYFKRLDSTEQIKYFYKCWTCKEAFIKAIGLGMSFPLKNIQTHINVQNKMEILHINSNQFSHEDWFCTSLSAGKDYPVTAVTNFKPDPLYITHKN
tara:strand:+ start:47776 stop:48507 length:732 start_codon:yes stop_codon:yes gene_type:complete